MENIYTLYATGGTLYYGINAASKENISEIGTPYDGSYEELANAFGGESYVRNYIDENEVLTAFLPLYDSNDNLVALVGCDSDATFVDARLQYSRKYIILVATLDLIIALLICQLSIKNITKGIRLVNEKIYELVHKEGDLTQTLNIKSGDEVELIADNINELLAFIREIMVKISNNSSSLKEATTDISNKISASEQKVDDVSEMMQQMSASMQETGATLNQIKESVSHIDDSMLDFTSKADNGNNLSQRVMEQSEVIHTNVLSEKDNAGLRVSNMQKEMEERIEQSKAVEEISLLTDEILDITERTKLLALNASIEAARAGESGKGFAVVAEEIGKLAQNSAVAAEQISHVSGNVVHAVNGLSGKATEMITFMDEVTMQGYDRLLETSDYYSNYIEQLNTMMTDFSTASNQLRETIRLVSTSVDSLNAAVEVNVSDITDVASVALTMSDDMAQMKTDATCNKDISLKLNNEVDKFKL